jgi:hypothetical protein
MKRRGEKEAAIIYCQQTLNRECFIVACRQCNVNDSTYGCQQAVIVPE